MEGLQRLVGKRIAVLAADGFEKVELTVPVAALRTAGAEVDVISLRAGRIRGVNLHEPASRVKVDYTLAEASIDDYDALFIPGGFINPDLLRQSAPAREFVQQFDTTRKPIATLCHGPWLLASAGLTAGRRMTSWPGVRDDMVNAGATWVDASVVQEGNWLTSRGPQDLVPFVRALLPFFAGQPEDSRSAPTNTGGSSPQRAAPPELVLGVMKWLPRPSFRALAFAAALALFYAARNKRAGRCRPERTSPASRQGQP